MGVANVVSFLSYVWTQLKWIHLPMERVPETYALVGISSLKLLDLAHLDLTVTLLQLTINPKTQN
jgi:hypothetical protein